SILFLSLPPTLYLSTLSLHDALPILSAPAHSRSSTPGGSRRSAAARSRIGVRVAIMLSASTRLQSRQPQPAVRHFCATSATVSRSEEHTSELQSRVDLVCRLLLEKKK